MEHALSGQDDSAVIRGLQALLPVILEFWDRPEAFREAAGPVLAKEMGFPTGHGDKLATLADQAFRQVVRLRTNQFRPFQHPEILDQAYVRLVPSATDSPVRQGFLWLAFQVQRAAIDFLKGVEGKAALEQVKTAVDQQKLLFQNLQTDSPQFSMTMVEKILRAILGKAVPEVKNPFHQTVICGALIEWARAEARKGTEQDLLSANTLTGTENARLLTSLVVPVREAELKEAHQRFLRMGNQEKTRRFDFLRKVLARSIPEVAKAAPRGFENFCIAVEELLFPYPSQLEWMRSYLKPIYANAQQSTVFDNCVNIAAISQRYEKLKGEKSSNITMLELARALALAKVGKTAEPEQKEFLEKLNLRSEFKWPTSVEELKGQRQVYAK